MRNDREVMLKQIKEELEENIDFRKDISDEEILEIIKFAVFEKSKQCLMTIAEKREAVEIIFNSMRRLDILQPVIDDSSVTEIMVNGPDNIFIERMGRVSKLELYFESRQKLEDVIQSVVSKANRMVNEANPIVDARLEDGSRVSVVLQPVAINGPIMTIRKFPDKPMTVEDLIKYGTLTKESAEVLRSFVRAKYNIFISGGTGSGKTTLLNILSGFIPSEERIITIEDSAELQLNGIVNLVRMETRNPNTEGKGQITIRDLIRASLRMRPDRIIIGEVRGAEALDMLQALNTGHDGSLSTGHANSTADMLSRLETMVLTAAQLPLEAIRQQIASAIDIVIQLSRIRDKSRRILEISEVTGYKKGEIILNPLYVFEEEGTCGDEIVGELKRTGNGLVKKMKLKMAGILCNI